MLLHYQHVIQIWVVAKPNAQKFHYPQVLILSFHRSLNVDPLPFCDRHTVIYVSTCDLRVLVSFVL